MAVRPGKKYFGVWLNSPDYEHLLKLQRMTGYDGAKIVRLALRMTTRESIAEGVGLGLAEDPAQGEQEPAA